MIYFSPSIPVERCYNLLHSVRFIRFWAFALRENMNILHLQMIKFFRFPALRWRMRSTIWSGEKYRTICGASHWPCSELRRTNWRSQATIIWNRIKQSQTITTLLWLLSSSFSYQDKFILKCNRRRRIPRNILSSKSNKFYFPMMKITSLLIIYPKIYRIIF